MAQKVVVERKVRWVLALIVLLLLAVPILALRKYVATTGESRIHTSLVATDERLVTIDGHSMLVQPDAVGPTMTHWVKSPNEETLSFEFSDRSFVANSAAPRPITVQRIRQVAQLTRSSPEVMVHIVLPAQFASEAAKQLDLKRASRVRNDLVSEGVATSHVGVEEEGVDMTVANGAQMAVLLTK